MVGDEERALLEQPPGGARRARLRRGRPAARRAARPRLRGARRAAGARARAGLVADNVLYGRNPVHEALRAGRRRVHEVWATTGAQREDWLAGQRVQLATAAGARAALRLARPPGRRRARRPVPLRRPRPTCSPGRTRCSSRSTRCRTRRTSARSAAPPRRRARPASCCPSGGPRTSRRRSRRPRPAPWSTCPSPSCATSPTRSARRATRGCWVYGAAAGARTRLRRRRLARAASSSSSAPRAAGLRPRVASSCDDLVSLPLRGQRRIAQRERHGGGPAVRGRARTLPRS